MARMMPAYCPQDAPPGEKAVYAALRDDPDTADWIVLHSLAIADHVRRVQGEADFVVIVPGAGVLVVEVKSHESVHRHRDGSWKLGHSAPTTRGPFQQANEAMHSVRGFLKKQYVDLHNVPMMSAVWFTHARALPTVPAILEWHAWQLLGPEDLPKAPAAVRRTLTAGAEHLDDKIPHFRDGGTGPDGATAQRIAAVLRPEFELVTCAGDRRRRREEQLISFIEEQFLALDAVADNRSLLFTGPAGSGKTFLAMEAARRERATGGQGRLLCYNRFLGMRLAADLSDIMGPALTVGTFHHELLRLAGLDRVPTSPGQRFWDEELPERALEALTKPGARPAGDFLVVDEIQDIASEPYLDVLDLMVTGGLREGRVLLFGDFEHQGLYGSESGRARLRARAPHLATYRLQHNCRNLPRIGRQVNLLSRLTPGYRDFRRQDDGIDPTLRSYRSGEDQSPLLVAALRDLQGEGFALNEIVVLSARRDGATAATTSDSWLRQILEPVDGMPARPGRVQYATIHAFKGLEAPAVVVTDLDRAVVSAGFDALLYVGLTRATDRLIAFMETATLKAIAGAGQTA